MHQFLINLGKVLFRYRAVIAVPFFILLIIFSRPTHLYIISCVLIVTGMLTRIWAAGYLGEKSRAKTFTTQYAVTSRPYRYLKHPLYLSNFLLVSGVIILFNPPEWFGILLMLLFLVEYSIIIYSEMDYLKNLPKRNTEFKLVNCKGEISTVFIVSVILLIHHFIEFITTSLSYRNH